MKLTTVWFSRAATIFGGADCVAYNKRFAYVQMPGRRERVMIRLSKLPPREKWTAFNVAEAVLAMGG